MHLYRYFSPYKNFLHFYNLTLKKWSLIKKTTFKLFYFMQLYKKDITAIAIIKIIITFPIKKFHKKLVAIINAKNATNKLIITFTPLGFIYINIISLFSLLINMLNLLHNFYN